MSKTAVMHIRVDSEIKAKAGPILSEMGISASELFNLLLNQVVVNKSVPFPIITRQSLEEGLNEYEAGKALSFDSYAKAKDWLNA